MKIASVEIAILLLLSTHWLTAMQTHNKDGNQLSEQQRKLNGELKRAIWQGDSAKAKSMLLQGADPNAHDDIYHKFTLFMLAVEYYGLFENDSKRERKAQVIEEMITYGADAQLKDVYDESALDIAVKKRYPQEIIDLLLKREKG